MYILFIFDLPAGEMKQMEYFAAGMKNVPSKSNMQLLHPYKN